MDIKKTKELLRNGKTIYDLNLRVAYYARVSTDKEDQLNSLENQQKYFEEMIKENHNWQFCGGYIDEGISGTAVKNREQFLKMIDASTHGEIDLILTKEISRFSRNTVDSIKYTEQLLKNGVIVHFLSDNLNTIQEDAEFRLTIMSSLAQDEIRKLSERVKFGINRMIKERKLIGGNLTGYFKKDGKYIINPNESPLITYLFETYATGSCSLSQISKELYNMGYTNSKGKPYSQTTLAKFLTNPRYKGYYTARLTEVEDYKTHKKRRLPKNEQIIEKDSQIPAIITEELWSLANELYNKRKKVTSRHIQNSSQSILNSKYTGIIHCHHCGTIFIRNGGSNRSTNPTWCCKKYKTEGISSCQSPIIPEKLLDQLFLTIFEHILPNKDKFINQILNDYETIFKETTSHNPQDILIQIEQIKNQKERLLNLYLQNIIDEQTFKKRNASLTSEQNNLEKKLTPSTNQPTPHSKQYLTIKAYLDAEIKSPTSLPKLIKLLIKKITITKINHNRKNIQLLIDYNFKRPPQTINLDFRT